MKKEEKTNKVEQKEKKSFKETVTLMFRKKWLADSTQTAIIVAILIAIFFAINFYVQSLDLQEIDVTEHKLHSLSDASIEAISKIDEDVKMYIYGFEETDNIMTFIKQYGKANSHITYEILTEESNLAKVQEYDLSEGYQIIVLETETSSKTIDVLNEFYSYDYTTGQQVDLTEQRLTNSLLGITTEHKPKVYFTTGHNEYGIESGQGLELFNTYLTNESYIVSSVNLLTSGKVPDDCNLLVLMNPVSDFIESEANAILDYINKGGDLIITSDVMITDAQTNLQKIYDAFGVTLNHSGYIYETETDRAVSSYPNIFIPEMSTSSDITTDIYTDGGVLILPFAGRLTFASDEQLTALNVTRDDILTSSENSLFIKDITQSSEVAAETAEAGQSVIASVLTKTITPASETTDGEEAIEAKLFVMANSVFATDFTVQQLNTQYPMFALRSNSDFILNTVSSLTAKDDVLKIRKDINSSTYVPTEQEHTIVLIIIFAVPILIIIAGIVVWQLRRRKK